MAVKVPPLLHKMSMAAQKAWYKKHGMEMPAAEKSSETKERSAAVAKRVKVEPRKTIAVEPGSVRALNAARQQAYMAKGGRQPIGAMGSGGSNVMAGAGQSTIKDLKASIKAGFNPRVSLDPYQGEKETKKKKVEEESKPDASMAMTHQLKMKMISDKDKRTLGKVAALMAAQKNKDKKNEYVRQLGLKAMKAGEIDPARGHSPTRFGREALKKEEVEQIDEIKISDVIKATRGKSPEEKQKIIQQMRDKENASKPKAAPRKLEPPKDIPMHQRVYPDDMKYHGDSVELEGPVMNEVTTKEAEKALGGPVKEKPKMPPGKQPAEYRYVRGLARRAMKAGLKKEEVELTEAPKDEREYGYEGDMAMSQLKSIIMNAQKLHDMLKPDTDLPEWVQLKITLAEDYVVTAANYCATEMSEEVEQVDEKINLVKAKMGDVIKDFQKSDAPQFKGKSQEKRRQMAVAAKLGAEREAGVREEIETTEEPIEEKYMGFAKLKASIAAKGGARDPAAVAAAIGRKKYGKEKFQAMAAAGKRKANEEVEDLSEDHQATYDKHMNAHYDAANAGDWEKAEKHAVTAEKAATKHFKATGKKIIDPGYTGPSKHIQREAAAGKRKANEEVETVSEDYQDTYDKHMNAHHDAANANDWEKAEKHAKTAERAAAMHFKATGKKIRDPGYTGPSKHIQREAVEGSVPTTPKEKELAAHHGDPNRITFGDVIKARLKSAAEKAMKKG